MRLFLLALCMLYAQPQEVIEVAKSYLGVPYIAGTLEAEGEERLIIREDGLDCTTFVELTVARWLASQKESRTFEEQVQQLRYRKGIVNGYLSRLHYFTDWVVENTHRGVWQELSPASEEESLIWHTDTLNLSFMSEHPQSYAYLKSNSCAIDSMRAIEQQYTHYPIHYIGKEHLNLPPTKLPIQNGDIIALVTTIEGLDVTHLGFAVWEGATLHLMHASMTHGKVVVDERPLYEYLRTRKNCPGVRVVRLTDEKKCD